MQRFREVTFAIGCYAAVAIVLGAALWMLGDVFGRGVAASLQGDRGAPSWWATFVTDGPRLAGREGGIAPILVSTALIVGTAVAVTVPLGIFTAIYLTEYAQRRTRFALLTRLSLQVLAGVPSIVFGLFGHAFFCVLLGMGFSILAGGLTLACMCLPLFIRAAEDSLRRIPLEQRLSAAALGISKVSTIRRILLPQAGRGLTAAFVLAMGRAFSETAALLFTSGYVDRMPGSLLDSGRALSVHIYDLATNVAGGDERAYASAMLLILAIAAINAIAHRLLRA